MPKSLKIGQFEIFWLRGGEFELDGGCMFGVVPRVLWQRKFPSGDDGHVRLANDPILVRTPEANIVIDSGLGNKLTGKQKAIFRVTREWQVEEGLAELGLNRNEISHVILTHCDFDHAGGVVMYGRSGAPELTFPEAVHHVQRAEWEDVLAPGRRAENSYWPVNLDLLKESPQLNLVGDRAEPVTGVEMVRTGGHTRGHQIIRLSSAGESAVHLGDLLPNQAHFHPLWVTPYDNFPLESIAQKEVLIAGEAEKNSWFLFYHDPYMAACRIDSGGEITERFVL
ncbi:MAG: MBL fold metallo-hydrolase [Proteobacteria bacterium]|nr:MBL fold metallo-hydrolase [Pseudomonadota bacterium]MBU1739404.1 MBL fold metallo-hydrolase [Pseudomonadota bacterium]